MKDRIPNVVIASILAEPAGQRKFAGFFSYLGTIHRWNLRVLREQDEIAAFFAKQYLDRSVPILLFEQEMFSFRLGRFGTA